MESKGTNLTCKTTDTVDIAEQVNKYLIGVGPRLASTINDNNEEPTKLL